MSKNSRCDGNTIVKDKEPLFCIVSEVRSVQTRRIRSVDHFLTGRNWEGGHIFSYFWPPSGPS